MNEKQYNPSKSLKRSKNNCVGATLPEYVLIVSLLCVACITGIRLVGQQSSETMLKLAVAVENQQTADNSAADQPPNTPAQSNSNNPQNSGGGCSRRHRNP